MDLANEKLFKTFEAAESLFSDDINIFIVKEGSLQKYKGSLTIPGELYYQMQRYVNPIVRFKTEADINEFMNTTTGVWKKDS